MSMIISDVAEAPRAPDRQTRRRADRWERACAIAGAAVAIAVVAFVYRFNTPEGSLGGFTNDQFAHLMRAEMLLRGQQPLRDFRDAELRGAWPALSYAVPAWAQELGGRTLLPEAWLTLGAIAIAHALVFPLAFALSRRWWVALLATAAAILTAPRAYSYPKVLMLALGVAALRFAMSRPSALALGLAAVVTAIATLFRHDCGVYIAVGLMVGLIGLGGDVRTLSRRLGLYAGFTALCLLPSALWVQVYEGIPSYVRGALVTAANEATRTKIELPPLWGFTVATSDGLVGLTYYAFWIVLLAAAVVLAIRTFDKVSPLSAADRATALGLLATAALANYFLLRGSLSQRLGDAAIPVVALAAWTAGSASWRASPVVRWWTTAVPVALLLGIGTATAWYGDVGRHLDQSGLTQSWAKTAERYAAVSDSLRRLPPKDWSALERDESLPQAARYVAECTTPDDYLLVAAEAPEIHVFAHRRFAAGQAALAMGLYTSQDDQRRALERLSGQSVPIVLADASRFQSEFIWTYPLLARYISDHYREVGTIDDRFLVFVDASRTPRRVDPFSGLPCFL
jgi:hypothetical protein